LVHFLNLLVHFLNMCFFLYIFAPEMEKDVTKLRDIELRRLFHLMTNSGVNSDYYSWQVICRLLYKQPAPRFYITPKKAEQYVYSMYHGNVKRKKFETLEMIRDLAENFERIKGEHPEKKKYEIWEEVVNCPAKSFYLKEVTIRHIVYGYLRPTNKRK